MNSRFSIEISEVKGKLNIGKNPWYVEILLIIIMIPFLIIFVPIWAIGNGIDYLFVKPFQKENKFEDLKWTVLIENENLKIEKSEPSNIFLSKKEMDWLDEDPIYSLKSIPELPFLEGKIFSDFIAEFDNRVFLQRILPVEENNDFELKSELISIDLSNFGVETIKQFDYYYLESEIGKNELEINGIDQIGSKLNLKIKNTFANNV
ncbi:hypothetical protein [Mangrovimonas cancribranchiae]|uniref:Uncharacterized protein n=1 Tax=Mangrovimonas cancribranchiae TaxID=3080055 RepID=A0AAU6P465_9FLAO